MSEQSINRSRSNAVLVVRMVLVSGAMFGFGFAVAPYYDRMCTYLGITPKATTQQSTESTYKIDANRNIALSFITTVNGAMPLEFRSEVTELPVHPGQYYTVRFYAKNVSGKTIFGQAIPSIAPVWVAGNLHKTECFCFQEQRFDPNVERELPVRFVIDPAVSPDVKDMTLSYTFFDITDQKSR